jgi:hypothetical protein
VTSPEPRCARFDLTRQFDRDALMNKLGPPEDPAIRRGAELALLHDLLRLLPPKEERE